jgi:hypothetical protein
VGSRIDSYFSLEFEGLKMMMNTVECEAWTIDGGEAAGGVAVEDRPASPFGPADDQSAFRTLTPVAYDEEEGEDEEFEDGEFDDEDESLGEDGESFEDDDEDFLDDEDEFDDEKDDSKDDDDDDDL